MTGNDHAFAVVREMAELGAQFSVAPKDSSGLQRWHWAPQPEIMRNAIRRHWRGLADRPSDAEMVAAIERMKMEAHL